MSEHRIQFLRRSEQGEQKNRPQLPIADSCLTVSTDQLPYGLLSQASIATQCAAGLRRVSFTEPFRLKHPAIADVRRLQAVRDLTSCSVEVDWVIDDNGDFDLRHLFSFFPPRSVAGNECLRTEWDAGFRFGSFYWRRGPEFLTVRDARYADVTILTLDTAEFLGPFLKYVNVDNLILTPSIRDLIAEGVLVVMSNWVMTVPYRMRYWPVPFNSV